MSARTTCATSTSNIESEDLVWLLIDELFCKTEEEARVTVESALEDGDNKNPVESITEFLELNPKEASRLLCRTRREEVVLSGPSDEDSSGFRKETVVDESEEEDCVGPGECVLCERYMKLTRHHLIPKTTWNRLETSIDSIESLSHLKGHNLKPKRSSYRQLLNSQTIEVCPACHSHIHRTHDHWTLAVSYNTLDRLLDDPGIYRFAKWASSQRPGKYANGTVITGRRKLKKLKK